MFIVYIQDSEMHKDLLFSTNTEKTAQSFCDCVNNHVRNLSKVYMSEYYNVRPLDKSWFHKSGWHQKVKVIEVELQKTTDKIDCSKLNMMVRHGDYLKYDRIDMLS
jgi:hypothetical protein